jgi:hypothetical protein
MSKRLLFACLILLLSPSLALYAQEERGWTFSGNFRGSTSSAGSVLKLDPTLGYAFNPHLETYIGLPGYFVNKSATTSTTGGSVSGIGNAYVGIRMGIDTDEMNFVSNLVVTAPTGDRDKGFSTGRATADWTNSFSKRLSSITPFADIGVANTVSDTSFFVRPFSSLGLVGHLDGGVIMSVAPLVDVGASAYSVRASGQQRIFSKVVRQSSSVGSQAQSGKGKGVFETSGETVGTADIANDGGFSTWLSVKPHSRFGFDVGYTRSVTYELNTVFFGTSVRFK